jgi:hypothetical protein
MGEFQQYFDIILFAMVAGFLVLRLRSVLGRRTGNERRRDLFPRRAAPASSDNVASLVEPDKRSTRLADDGPSATQLPRGLADFVVPIRVLIHRILSRVRAPLSK